MTYLIYFPKNLHILLVEWCHETLKHPGKSRTKDIICQHYDWPNLTIIINEVVRKYYC